MSVRHLVQLLGPTVTLVGLVYSVLGTYFLTRLYHPYRVWDFCVAVAKAIFYTLFFQTKKILKIARVAVATGAITPEDRARSLLGIYFIFFGFLLQMIGAIFWATDSFWGVFFEHACSACPPG